MTARKPYPVGVAPGVAVRPIPGYEGLYSVTEEGRVWSEVRSVPHKYSRMILVGGKWLTPARRRDGYLYVPLLRNAVQKFAPVHRLVALAWLPPAAEDAKWINHKNGTKTDNRAINLEWCTPSQNIVHAYRTGLRRAARARLSDIEVATLRGRIAAGEQQRRLAAEYGIAESAVSAIKHGRSYRLMGNEIEFSIEPPSAAEMAEAA
ncbi:HNH endonuclease [Bordetella bronchialis]|uniref:HNH endonuclease n=1 Tax=Bordetella bronchialis TaxID=463025 RepID=UPI003CFFFC5B